MFKLSRGGAVLFAALVVVTVGAFYIAAQLTKLNVSLLPASASGYPWKASFNSDVVFGGTSVISIRDSNSSLSFDFNLDAEHSNPWVAFTLRFGDAREPDPYVNWSRYATLNLVISCAPSNSLSLSLYTFDEQFTVPSDFSTFRNPTAFFNCGEDRQRVKLDLRELDVPDWWLYEHRLPLSNQQYRLDKIWGLTVHNTYQSPRQTLSKVHIHSATLEGRDWRYLYGYGVLAAAVWGGFLFWIFRQYNRVRIERIKEEVRKDQPFIPYQQLPAVTRQDKNKSAVLSYLSTEYANPDLNIETVASAIGVSRTKINEILKDERGLTFSAYLNKLRLAEAARLLLEKDTSVAEIAYAVGYNNTSYFITVFKKEYGCTPKAFKKHTQADAGELSGSE